MKHKCRNSSTEDKDINGTKIYHSKKTEACRKKSGRKSLEKKTGKKPSNQTDQSRKKGVKTRTDDR